MILNATDASNVEDCNSESEIDNTITRGDQATRTRSTSFSNRQTGCSSNPCLNNGQCYPLNPTEYKCSCLPGFAGINCELPQEICAHRPCQNQGICRGNNTHYVCDCVLGHSGTNCDQSKQMKMTLSAHRQFPAAAVLLNKNYTPIAIKQKRDEVQTISLFLY